MVTTPCFIDPIIFIVEITIFGFIHLRGKRMG